jgi:SAM-dependent methyltransferase
MDYDRTPLPEVYRSARTLPAETMDVWGRAIRAMLPESTPLDRVIDLGCGTARFTRLLADVLHASVVGVEPSLRMLAEREVRDARLARFVAATAEALPLADVAAADLRRRVHAGPARVRGILPIRRTPRTVLRIRRAVPLLPPPMILAELVDGLTSAVERRFRRKEERSSSFRGPRPADRRPETINQFRELH